MLLVGDVAPLSLDSHEESEIGAALATCLATLPTPIGETVGMLGPWSKLVSTLGGAILKRMAMITAAKVAARAAAQPTRGPQAEKPTVPQAPQPNGHVAQPFDIVAPVPMQL